MGNLDQRLLRPWQERERPPGKRGTLETTEVEIQTKEVQEYLRVLIYLYSLKGLYSRVNQKLPIWSVHRVWQVHGGQTTGSITIRLTVLTEK